MLPLVMISRALKVNLNFSLCHSPAEPFFDDYGYHYFLIEIFNVCLIAYAVRMVTYLYVEALNWMTRILSGGNKAIKKNEWYIYEWAEWYMVISWLYKRKVWRPLSTSYRVISLPTHKKNKWRSHFGCWTAQTWPWITGLSYSHWSPDAKTIKSTKVHNEGH